MIFSGGIIIDGNVSITSLSPPGPVTITSATMTGATTATISFTGPTVPGSFTVTSVTAVSYPGLVTRILNTSGTGTITISGLSSSTFYKFSVYARSEVGPGTEVTTPILLPYTYGSQEYTTPGTYSWLNANPLVSSVSVVAVGAGGSGKTSLGTVVSAGAGGTSTFISGSVASAFGGNNGNSTGAGNYAGTGQGGTGAVGAVISYGGSGGGAGVACATGGGGGAGGYTSSAGFNYGIFTNSNRYLSISGIAALGTCNFTAEAWVYISSTGTYTVYSTGATGGIAMGVAGCGRPYGAVGVTYGAAGEGGTLTLTPPSGYVMTSAIFGKYGIINGTAPDYTVCGVKGAGTQAKVESYIIGKTSASIPANNGTWTDPAPSQGGKQLAIVTTHGLMGTTSSLAVNTWNHLALVRTGTGAGQTVFYVNGVSAGSATLATNYTVTPTYWIGASYQTYYPTGELFFTGNISNTRIVKGIGVYTGAFTVPTPPLGATQSAGTNISAIASASSTQLLTLSANTLTDTGGFARTITNSGGVVLVSVAGPGGGTGGTTGVAGLTSTSGGGGGGGVATGSYGAGGGGVGLYGQGSGGAGGVSGLTTGTGGGGGSSGSIGTSTFSAGTPGGGGLYGGGGGGGAAGAGGALVYANNISVTSGSSYTVVVGAPSTPSGSANSIGGGGAVRIVWPGNIRQFPSTLVGSCASLALVSGFQNFSFPVVTSSTTFIQSGRTTGVVYVRDAFTQTGITSYLFSGQVGDVMAEAYTTSGSAVLYFEGITVPSTATIYSTSILGNSIGSTSMTFSAIINGLDYIVVAGGGGGGVGTAWGNNSAGGGGGGGGYISSTGASITRGMSYTVTVGAGGAGGLVTNGSGIGATVSAASTGSISAISSLATAIGGGSGGYYTPTNGITDGGIGGSGGGSGSGGGGQSRVGGAGTAGQGLAGGNNFANCSTGAAGGGGGAGTVGAAGASAIGGAGGNGTFTTIISTTTAISLGIGQYITATNAVYFAGGGGGGYGGVTTQGLGGYGGGGNARNAANVVASLPNTGGGGGGAGNGATGVIGGTGGSGAVIIRYPDTYAAAVVTTATYIVSGGYRTYIFTSSGTILF